MEIYHIMRFGLPETTIANIQAVLAQYPQIEQAILYGSRAKGTYKPGSDIDLTLVGGEEVTLDVLSLVMDALDDLLLPYTFDLSFFFIRPVTPMSSSTSGGLG